MERLEIVPRPDYGQKLESIGLSFYDWDKYWKEDACYRFTSAQIDELEEATEEVHRLCLQAVDFVIREKLLGKLGIPENFWERIARSWEQGEKSLYGRFDFAYDGENPPKMLEYNADTPTSLLESGVAQWYWMKDQFPEADQFNSLHEKLIDRWKEILSGGRGVVHVASLAENEEDWVCASYMSDLIIQAGRESKHIAIEDIGWDSERECFVDMDGDRISTIFKLYPWEWMMRDEFGEKVGVDGTQFVEPLWKAVLSCKGILPILWQLFPDHPNLLPAFFEPGKLDSYAKKPLFSREGANVELFRNGELVDSDDGPYGAEGFIYQALCPLPEFEGKYPVIGSWVVGDASAGMCIREDVSGITTNMSNFVPHFFVD